MVQRAIKIPKHGGPDGQGLPTTVFTELLKIFQDSTVSDQDAEASVLLAFSASAQTEWNEQYRPMLLTMCIDNTKQPAYNNKI